MGYLHREKKKDREYLRHLQCMPEVFFIGNCVL